MRILFLDDDGLRYQQFEQAMAGTHEIVWAKDAEQAFAALQKAPQFDLAFLDHDLDEAHYYGQYGDQYGSSAPTGDDVCRFICEKLNRLLRPVQCIIHSMNPGGAMSMLGRLRDENIRADKLIFGGKPFWSFVEQIRKMP